jgi:hypothetical protein
MAPTPTRKVQSMMVTMLRREGWSSEEEYRPSGAKRLSHLMRHAVKKRLEGWHLIVPPEHFQRSPMGRSRIYEDLIARRGMSRSGVDVDARNRSVEGVVACEVPSDRDRRR